MTSPLLLLILFFRELRLDAGDGDRDRLVLGVRDGYVDLLDAHLLRGGLRISVKLWFVSR